MKYFSLDGRARAVLASCSRASGVRDRSREQPANVVKGERRVTVTPEQESRITVVTPELFPRPDKVTAGRLEPRLLL